MRRDEDPFPAPSGWMRARHSHIPPPIPSLTPHPSPLQTGRHTHAKVNPSQQA